MLKLFMMAPHAKDLDRSLALENLVRQTLLNPDFRFDDCPLTIAALSAPL
jgi:hypothetical protein